MKIYPFAEYSNLFKEDEKKVLEEIKKLDFEHCCKILSVLGCYERNSDRNILSTTLIDYFPELESKDTIDYLKKTDLVSRHGVLLAWKYLLANNSNNSSSYSENNIKYILKLILIMQQHYLNIDIQDKTCFLMSNSIFNYYDCEINQLARSYYIFVKNKYFKSKTVNISKFKNTFKDKYGVTLEKYIYLVNMVISYVNGLNKSRDIEHFFPAKYEINPYNLPKISKDVQPLLINLLDQLSFESNEGSNWSKNCILEESEISLFINKPLIKINSNCYIPIEHKLLKDLLFNSLFHKIRNCFEETDHEFMDSFGHMFQDYIEWIASSMCKKSMGFYTLIKEFKYGNKNHSSPDLMILHKDSKIGDTVLVIEVKSARPLHTLNDYFNTDLEDLEKSVKKLITTPLMQSMKSINEIINEQSHKNITKDKTYYFLSVTMNNIPFKRLKTNEITEQIRNNKYSNLRVAGFNSISIEEFELFLQVLMYPKNKPFRYYLEDYRKNFELNADSFKNYIKRFPKAKDFEDIDSIYYDPITILGRESAEKAKKYFLKK